MASVFWKYMDFRVGGRKVASAAKAGALSKYYCFIAIKKDAVFDMPTNRAGKDDFLEVAALADEVFHGVAVGDADHVLFDDGPIVENFSDVVAGCPDQLYAAFEGLMVGSGADEGRQK